MTKTADRDAWQIVTKYRNRDPAREPLTRMTRNLSGLGGSEMLGRLETDALEDQRTGGRCRIADVDRPGQFRPGRVEPARVIAVQFHEGLALGHALARLGEAHHAGGRR